MTRCHSQWEVLQDGKGKEAMVKKAVKKVGKRVERRLGR